jgi:hypothetical protein
VQFYILGEDTYIFENLCIYSYINIITSTIFDTQSYLISKKINLILLRVAPIMLDLDSFLWLPMV